MRKTRLRLTLLYGHPERTAIMFACKGAITKLGYKVSNETCSRTRHWFDIEIELQALIRKEVRKDEENTGRISHRYSHS